MHSARFLLAAALSIGFVSAQTCDRACLKTTLDQYLNAVVKHDPQAAPLFAGFRQTDNGIPVRMAIFATLLGVDKLVSRSMRDAAWTPPSHIGPDDSTFHGLD